MEERLRVAILARNADELDQIIDDRLLFIAADGSLRNKKKEIALYENGDERLSRFDVEQLLIETHDTTAIAVVLVSLAGLYKGSPFARRCQYIRTWVRKAEGWRLAGGSSFAVLELDP